MRTRPRLGTARRRSGPRWWPEPSKLLKRIHHRACEIARRSIVKRHDIALLVGPCPAGLGQDRAVSRVRTVRRLTLGPAALQRRAVLAGSAGLLALVSCGAGGEVEGDTVRDGPRAWSVPARPVTVPPLPQGHVLEALGGLELDRGAIGFGGFSGLHLDDDLRLTAVSDLARWMTARLVLREDGRPSGLADLRTGKLRDGAGRPLARGYAGDAEGLARLADGSWLVSFERWHRLRSFRSIQGPGFYVETPPGLEKAPLNGGVEALAVLANGDWLIVTESMSGGTDPRLRQAWLGKPGAWKPVLYRGSEGFDPVDATALPDGGAFILERKFSLLRGFGGRVVRLSAAQVRGAEPGAVLEGEEILSLSSPLPTENYEAIATARCRGRTVLAILSDDNENMLQRSLLLLFAYPGA